MARASLPERAQAAALRALIAAVAALPVDVASALGAGAGRAVGRAWRRRDGRALAQLAYAMPELDAAGRRRIVDGMWANIGRNAAELPHLERIAADPARLEVVGAEHLRRLAGTGAAAILVSGHLGNWELLGPVARRLGMPLHVVYRHANNAAVDAVIRAYRLRGAVGLVPKGAEGARALLRLLARGGRVGLLVDQRMSDGIEAPLFGRPAMTSAAAAQLALRFGLPLLPAHCQRLDGAHFRIVVDAPLELAVTGDRRADVLAATVRLNALLEGWIRDRPEQWLWLHRRWRDATAEA